MEKISDVVLEQIRRDGVVPRSMGKSMAEELVECRRAVRGNPAEVKKSDGRLSTQLGMDAEQRKRCDVAANHIYMAFNWRVHPAGERFWTTVHEYLTELSK